VNLNSTWLFLVPIVVWNRLKKKKKKLKEKKTKNKNKNSNLNFEVVMCRQVTSSAYNSMEVLVDLYLF
jgi:hypothetical protein